MPKAKRKEVVKSASDDHKEVALDIGTSVIIHGLISACEFNDLSGIVRSAINANYRQSVWIPSVKKEILIKPSNMRSEKNRDASSLTIKEMHAVLASKGVAATKTTGLDKAGLQELVEESVSPRDDLSALIIQGREKLESRSLGNAASVNESDVSRSYIISVRSSPISLTLNLICRFVKTPKP